MESKRCNMPARLAIFLAIFTVACAARAIDTLSDDGFRARHRSLLATEELESKIDDLMKGHDDMWKADHLKHDKDETAKHSKTSTSKLDKTSTGKLEKTSTGKLEKTSTAKLDKTSTAKLDKTSTAKKYDAIDASDKHGAKWAKHDKTSTAKYSKTSTAKQNSSPSLTYVGCYIDNVTPGVPGGRGLPNYLGQLDLESCADAASAAGYARFALQWPEGEPEVGKAECWADDGDLLGPQGPFTLTANAECKGEPWNPMAYGDTFTYNGAGNRNAVYKFTPLSTPKKDEDYLADCVKTAHYQCNAFLPLYGPCFMKHWSLCIAEEVYEEKDAAWEDHKYSKYDK